jgi:predicted DNA-binding protein with PD1-like motif
MQSTRSASTIALRISPSPDWFDDIEPLASTKPAVPFGAKWCMKCCTQAKLALPAGGVP